MTNPTQGSDDRREWPAGPADPDHQATRPVPSLGPPTDPGTHATRPVPSLGPPPQPGVPYTAPHVPPPQQAYGPPVPQQYGAPQYGAPSYGAPSYGGHPYGPPPYGRPAPARKSPLGLIAVVTAGILVLITGAVVLALTQSSTVLDRNAVERDVAAQFEEREGVAIDLHCAEEMEVRSDATYDCSGTTADGEDVLLQITITDEDSAAYTWTEP
jgi:hypothetical protein